MPRGRPAKPTIQKILEGNPGKRPLNMSEPKPRGALNMPEHMTTIGEIVWKRTIGAMPEGFFTSADTYALASYCEAVSTWHEATRYFAEGGSMIVRGSTGQDVPSPWIKIQADAARQINSFGVRLGLDPVARTSLNYNPSDEEEDEFGTLIN
jgi:P27 family predicted phage terminase small subunit